MILYMSGGCNGGNRPGAVSQGFGVLAEETKRELTLGLLHPGQFTAVGARSEPPREIGLDRMIARVVRELTEIANADLRLRAQLQVTTRFDQCGVACDRDAQDAERRVGILKRKQRARRHRAKSVLPSERRARHEHPAVRHEVVAGPARAER